MTNWLEHHGVTRQEFPNPVTLRWRMKPRILVVHTTEGSDYPSAATYRYGKSAPHITIHPRKRTARQHYGFNEAAWALRAPTGVSTNTWGAIQVEIIGTCVETNVGKSWSVLTFDEGDLEYIASIFRAISEATDIPLRSGVDWLPYPASYGDSRVRLGRDAWYGYTGVLGHMHVPGNSHGDPGRLAVGRILELAQPVVVPLPPPKPLTTEESAAMDRFVEMFYEHHLLRPAARQEVNAWLDVIAEVGLTRARALFLTDPAVVAVSKLSDAEKASRRTENGL